MIIQILTNKNSKIYLLVRSMKVRANFAIKLDYLSQIGIRRLLNIGGYVAAYPLHEGSHIKTTNSRCVSDRQVRKINFKKMKYNDFEI